MAQGHISLSLRPSTIVWGLLMPFCLLLSSTVFSKFLHLHHTIPPRQLSLSLYLHPLQRFPLNYLPIPNIIIKYYFSYLYTIYYQFFQLKTQTRTQAEGKATAAVALHLACSIVVLQAGRGGCRAYVVEQEAP
jgi:hypothetical protein